MKINIPSPRTPVPVPDQSPDVDIVNVNGRIVTIRVHDASSETKRSKPKGCASAAIFTFIGTTPPADPSGYKFQGFTTKTVVPIQFDDSVPSGSLIWISAAWLNPRGQFGVASAPRSFTLQGGPAVAAA